MKIKASIIETQINGLTGDYLIIIKLESEKSTTYQKIEGNVYVEKKYAKD